MAYIEAISSSSAKEEQTKTITATTSQQTVTPDAGKVLSSVTVNPQVHSNVFVASDYGEFNMGQHHNYRYVNTTDLRPNPTALIPSDSSPMNIVADTLYYSESGGYAIESQPTSITPSNSSPVTISSGTIYKASGNGKAIESFSEIVPSNSSPVSLSVGSIYKVKTNTGKAVANITDITPSSTPTAVSADDIVHIGGSGSVVDLSGDTATASDVVNGKTFHTDSGLKTGSISVVQGMRISMPSSSSSWYMGSTYYKNCSLVLDQNDFKAENIKKDVNIYGITGTYEGGKPEETKNVTPYTTAQTIIPTSGYAISQVNVAAITYTETENAAGGLTVTIGAVAP